MSNFSKIRTTINQILGKVSNLKKQISIGSTWYGNSYGGFFVADGYLNKNSIIYSFGIGEDISFDESLIQEFDCKIYGFDPTPKSIKWIENRKTSPNFIFSPYGINSVSGMVDFLLPKNENYVSGSIEHQINVNENKKISVPMKSLEDIVKDLKHNKIDVLKIDIEGSEYNIIQSIVEAPVEITQILIEIHERFFTDGVSKTKKMIAMLNKHGYKLFAVSSGMEELSFIKSNKE